MAYCQKKISLDEFKEFSQLKSYKSFEGFSNRYKYTLFNSNLVESYQYDDLGFIKKIKFKKFFALKNGDSLLFNRHFKIYELGKRTNDYNNHISFFQKEEGISVNFTATSLVAGHSYFEELTQECKTANFYTTKSDTLYTANTVSFIYEAQKANYTIKCQAVITKKEADKTSTPTETIKYSINFMSKQ